MNEPGFKPLLFFIAVHNNFPLPPPHDDYVALGLGGYRPATPMRAHSDEFGELISHKNKNFCELTGWYWLWKNVSNVKFIGLNHYRRYFFLDPNSEMFCKYNVITVPANKANLEYLTAPERSEFAQEIMSSCDVIVPRRWQMNEFMSSQYLNCHLKEDWELFTSTIHELWPQYASWFDRTGYLYAYNMMIASKVFFDAYMSSLFDVLTRMEQKRSFSTDSYQCRAPGFLAERFFTFYLSLVGARCFEVPIVLIKKEEDNSNE